MTSLSRFLESQLRDAPSNIWASLAACSHLVSLKLSTYNPLNRTTSPPPAVPWPILWFLIFFARKHRFCKSRRLPIEWLQKDNMSYVNKIHWRLHFQRQPSPMAPLYIKSSSTPSCPFMVNPHFKPWAAHFRRILLESAMSYSRHYSSVNTFGLVRIAMKAIKNIPYIIIPNDKDAGYSFTHIDHARALERNTLSPLHYTPVAMQQLNFSSIRTQFIGLAKRIAQLEDSPSLVSILCKPLSGLLPTQLAYTAKVHKPQGEVVARPLHKAINPAFISFSSWLVIKLKPLLLSLNHVVHDTHQFCKRVHNVPFGPGYRMAVVDVKDFYLSGSAADIATDVSSLFVNALASLVKETIHSLLEHQYVFAIMLQAFYRCFHGTGMGLKHSGHCANLAFYVAVELHFINNLHALGIKTYLRYHDDIFIFLIVSSQCYHSSNLLWFSLPILSWSLVLYHKHVLNISMLLCSRLGAILLCSLHLQKYPHLCMSHRAIPKLCSALGRRLWCAVLWIWPVMCNLP